MSKKDTLTQIIEETKRRLPNLVTSIKDYMNLVRFPLELGSIPTAASIFYFFFANISYKNKSYDEAENNAKHITQEVIAIVYEVGKANERILANARAAASSCKSFEARGRRFAPLRSELSRKWFVS